MNFGITTSFVVGGLLLLAMLHLNGQVLQNSVEITLNATDKTKVETIRQVITQDLKRIGFGNNSSIAAFNPPNFINFRADVHGQGTSQVIWNFQENVQVNETTNPDDRVLRRNGPIDSTGGSRPTVFNVVDFSMTGYSDAQGTNVTTDRNQIRSIRVKIVTESPEPLNGANGQNYYPRTVWEKLIVPTNLQF
ncbi:hypothetical protein CK503_12785 [Aliifodinibius salipaludis]|uniref:Uncharacterized protein n=1 Tax=Fodinibius salipaludis TaxID=2032627 RepID=A0A2A2G8Z7_9BACT|nr:hypothetical protein [Aliifodinibius salipaludis]PAU93292.1 hypothetical protein CK503_12785 [Aliifodinibius salipaludis]